MLCDLRYYYNELQLSAKDEHPARETHVKVTQMAAKHCGQGRYPTRRVPCHDSAAIFPRKLVRCPLLDIPPKSSHVVIGSRAVLTCTMHDRASVPLAFTRLLNAPHGDPPLSLLEVSRDRHWSARIWKRARASDARPAFPHLRISGSFPLYSVSASEHELSRGI